MAALDSIVNNMPVANQQRVQQQRAATDLQLQQAVRAVPPKQAGPQVAQTLGAAAAQQTGQAQVQQAQQNVAVNQQAGGMAVQQKANELQQNIATLKRGQDTQQLSDEQQFANLSQQAKQEMFDSRMQFSKDEMGRTMFNERQLADYAVSHARDQQQLADYAQSAQQIQQRKAQALTAAQARISQELEFQNSLDIQKQDNQLKQQLTQAKYDLDKKLAKDRADAANRAGIFSTVLGIGGAAAGGMAGGPAGAGVGMGLGSSVGGLAASRTTPGSTVLG